MLNRHVHVMLGIMAHTVPQWVARVCVTPHRVGSMEPAIRSAAASAKQGGLVPNAQQMTMSVRQVRVRMEPAAGRLSMSIT